MNESKIKDKSKVLTIAKFNVLITIVIMTMLQLSMMAQAAEDNNAVEGKYYEFDEKSNYEITLEDHLDNGVSGENNFGLFELAGDFKHEGTKTGYDIYSVNSGVLELVYTFDKSKLNVPETEWYLIEDKTKKIDAIELDDKINMGAIVLQSSMDSVTWTNDFTRTNVFTEESPINVFEYTTNDIQQLNGCYFRLIIAYEMETITEKNDSWIKKDTKSSKKIAEVYEFYVENKDASDLAHAEDDPQKEIGYKVNTGKENGYFENNAVNIDDPHYGWDLGSFHVGGYTRETENDDGDLIFLKNVGDKVTLWYNLEQDINRLDDNEELIIDEDVDGYFKEFEIDKTNLGRGTLIIRYTDHEGLIHEPVIYTNYLEANTRTGADTRVQLFEEGDYEVILCYKIKQKRTGLSLLADYTYYKVPIKFSIRNGNCMVYPFDTSTGSELSDGSITANGFNLDMAKSRYLTIDVTKSVLKVALDGTLVEDVRSNSPAKDGEVYTDEGIYSFTIKNLYTKAEPTTKTIYVGIDKHLILLSKSGHSLSEVNEKIVLGAEILDDGTILEPVEETDDSTEEMSDDTEVAESLVEEGVDKLEVNEDNINNQLSEDSLTKIEPENNDENGLITPVQLNWILGFISVLCIMILTIVLVSRKRK